MARHLVGQRLEARHVGAGEREAVEHPEQQRAPDALGEQRVAERGEAGHQRERDHHAPRVDAVGEGDQERHAGHVAGVGSTAADPAGLGVGEPPLGDEGRDQRLEGHRPGHRQDLGGAERSATERCGASGIVQGVVGRQMAQAVAALDAQDRPLADHRAACRNRTSTGAAAGRRRSGSSPRAGRLDPRRRARTRARTGRSRGCGRSTRGRRPASGGWPRSRSARASGSIRPTCASVLRTPARAILRVSRDTVPAPPSSVPTATMPTRSAAAVRCSPRARRSRDSRSAPERAQRRELGLGQGSPARHRTSALGR